MNGASAVVAEGTPCGWCGQSEKSNSYILPLKNGRHAFCSEMCLCEFRKGACFQCGEVISGFPCQSIVNFLTRNFCDENCCKKYKKREQAKQIKLPSAVANSQNIPSPTVGSPIILPSVVGSNSCSFSWDDYLKETGSIAAPQHCFKQVYHNFYSFLVHIFQKYFSK